MPPWKTLLSEPQARWIAERLLEGFPEEERK
jgi:cytochrome c55X